MSAARFTPGRGGGAAQEELWYGFASHAAAANPGAFSVVAGNYTVGMAFTVCRPVMLAGVRFYWPSATPRTIKGAVRAYGGAAIASATLAIAASGLHEILFAAPAAVAPASGAATAAHTLAIWETSGTSYVRTTTAPPLISPGWSGSFRLPALISRSLIVETYMRFSGGDANPAFTGGSESFPVEPIFA